MNKLTTINSKSKPVRGHRANLMLIMDDDWILDEKVFEEVIVPFINRGFITTNAELYMSSAYKEDN